MNFFLEIDSDDTQPKVLEPFKKFVYFDLKMNREWVQLFYTKRFLKQREINDWFCNWLQTSWNLLIVYDNMLFGSKWAVSLIDESDTVQLISNGRFLQFLVVFSDATNSV